MAGRAAVRIIEKPVAAMLMSLSAAREQLDAIGDRPPKDLAQIRAAVLERIAEFDRPKPWLTKYHL